MYSQHPDISSTCILCIIINLVKHIRFQYQFESIHLIKKWRLFFFVKRNILDVADNYKYWSILSLYVYAGPILLNICWLFCWFSGLCFPSPENGDQWTVPATRAPGFCAFNCSKWLTHFMGSWYSTIAVGTCSRSFPIKSTKSQWTNTNCYYNLK